MTRRSVLFLGAGAWLTGCPMAAAQISIAATEMVIADVGIRPVNLRAADLNDDGVVDFVVANRGPEHDLKTRGNVSVILSDGAGGWVVGQSLNAPDLVAPYGLGLRDVTGNGHMDLIVGDGAGDRIFVFKGIGQGVFDGLDVDSFLAGPGILDFDLGFVDNDGELDVVTALYFHSSESTLLRGQGAGFFGAPEIIPNGHVAPYDVALVDIAGNGILDIIVAGTDRGFNVMAGLGNGAFAQPVNFTIVGSNLAPQTREAAFHFQNPPLFPLHPSVFLRVHPNPSHPIP